jgi:hypothetical protein
VSPFRFSYVSSCVAFTGAKVLTSVPDGNHEPGEKGYYCDYNYLLDVMHVCLIMNLNPFHFSERAPTLEKHRQSVGPLATRPRRREFLAS